MPISLYDATIPVMITGFANLTNCLQRGEAFADAHAIPHATLLNAKLYDDMMTLTGQIQRASDMAKRTAINLAGIANIPMPDTEASFPELHARIAATVAILQSVTPAQVAAREAEPIAMPASSRKGTVSAHTYVLDFALPNFFFHLATAYDLLRHHGVPLGKRHYLGWE
jgi:hypothetical protein